MEPDNAQANFQHIFPLPNETFMELTGKNSRPSVRPSPPFMTINSDGVCNPFSVGCDRGFTEAWSLRSCSDGARSDSCRCRRVGWDTS